MNRVSIVKQDKVENKNLRKDYRYCLVWMLIGILCGGIPLATIVSLYIKDSNKQNSSITTTLNTTPTLRWNPVGITVAGVTNQTGTSSNKLNFPFGLAIDYLNALYIADSFNHRIQKYQRGVSVGQTVAGRANGTTCSSSACLFTPADVTVDTNGNVYVADSYNNRVQLWSDGSSSGVTVAGNNSIGNSNNLLNKPFGITRDSDTGTLYISDTGNNRVMRYLSGTLSGTMVAGTGVFGTSNTQLSASYGIYLDLPTNSLIIANTAIHSIVRWVLGTSNWTFIAGNMNRTAGSSSTNLNTPVDATIDPMGNIYVVDSYNYRIQFFPMGQSYGITIAGITGVSGSNSTLLNIPYSVALDNQLNLYVADSLNHRVQKFLRY